jgi:hypothetical protein
MHAAPPPLMCPALQRINEALAQVGLTGVRDVIVGSPLRKGGCTQARREWRDGGGE